MIKAKQVFLGTSNLKGHGFHGDKTSKYYSLSVLSEQLNFLDIDPVSSKVIVILMQNAENVEFKFSRLKRHLKALMIN